MSSWEDTCIVVDSYFWDVNNKGYHTDLWKVKKNLQNKSSCDLTYVSCFPADSNCVALICCFIEETRMLCPWHGWPTYYIIRLKKKQMLNPHIKDSFWKIHLSNCGWLGILQRLLGGKRVLRCKWDWPPLFCCWWEKKRLKQKDKKRLTSLFLHSSLMRSLTRAPLCSLLCISMPPPSHLPLKSLHSVSPSLPLLYRLVLNLPEQMLQHLEDLITGCGGGCLAKTRWLTSN